MPTPALRRLSRPAQWSVALLGALLFLGIAAGVFTTPMRDVRWLPVLLIAPFLLAPLEGLLLTPLYTLARRFIYFSPLLLGTRSRVALELHVGTLFDYVTYLRWRDRGARNARIVLVELLQGLLAVIAEVERGAIAPETEIRATSYFFSDRTLSRLGFRICGPSPNARLNLAVGVIGIGLRLAYVRGRFTLPDPSRVRQGTTTAGELATRASAVRGILTRVRLAGGL